MSTDDTGTFSIEAEALSLWYGDFQALKQVSVRIRDGLITGLIGPSGCGKTTFLRCLNRLNERYGNVRTDGQIRILGKNIYDPDVSLGELRKSVGMVFQRPNPLPVSIYENIVFGMRVHRDKHQSRAALDEMVESALTEVALWNDVKDNLHRRATLLTLEQQQKLCIARLLPLKPRVILMDEPCSALDAEGTAAIERLMDGQLADMVFSDPPYNVDYGSGAKGKLQGKDRRILNDALGDGFYQFLYDACVNMLTVTKGACYICMSSSELHTLQRAFTDAGGKWSTFVIWAKNTFTLGRADYQRQYEPILYGWKQGADHFWCGARDQGDVWFVDKPRVNDLHPTMKPVELVERAIRNSSKSRDIVLDLFGGSGTTLVAAERTGRSARLLELDPRYVDVIVTRWQNLTGGVAVLDGEDRTFNDLRVARQQSSIEKLPA